MENEIASINCEQPWKWRVNESDYIKIPSTEYSRMIHVLKNLTFFLLKSFITRLLEKQKKISGNFPELIS